MKGLWLIPCALFIDGLQAALSLAFVGIATPVSGLLQFVPVVGTAAGASVGAAGIVLGFAVNLALSFSMGAGLVFGMVYCGLFTWRIFSAFIGEAVPGLNNLPVWTSVVIWALFKKYKEEKNQKEIRGRTTGLAFDPDVQKTRADQQKTSLRAVGQAFRGVGREVASAAFALLLCFGVATSAHAQVLPPPVQYVVTPETPGPHETVTIEAQGVGSFLGNADIVWKQDGKVVKNGTGERDYTFTTGGLGQKTTVTVNIDSSAGLFAQTFSFNPSKINLLWEADTSVPATYLGRALYSAGSSYKVVAFPTVYSGGAHIAPSALSYQWSYRGSALPDASGLGRAILVRTGDQLQTSEDIGVGVYYGTQKVGTAQLSIPATTPTLILYPRDALRGEVLESALPAAISLTATEITLQAEPYYFDNRAGATGQAPFVWSINGNPTSGPDSAAGILTLRQTGSGQGEAQVGVSVQNTNPDQFVQNAQTTLRLVFGAQTGSSLLNFLGL